ncbi:hypothetical protein RHS04_01924 [Rhizoctonia solani]|uniref:Uncharacterized protein n=1 Tax=Rhizoctonia solani TaxID=456999 RepID=A0A8H7IC83_9AGAM|nr:hypothetical protein RHS04_01924 [Rhizoctonia solani]KAF8756032.1 hypothetical protein RHS01_04917 [Rhizoctonia solani]
MLAAEKHRESHRRQVYSSNIGDTPDHKWGHHLRDKRNALGGRGSNCNTWSSGVNTWRCNKTQQREQLAYFALDTFIRKWHDWAYDLDRDTNIRWDDRRDELNEFNFNSAYDQIQRYELDSEANLVNFAYAVAANAPAIGGPTLPIGLGGIGGSPILTPPRKAPVSLPVTR